MVRPLLKRSILNSQRRLDAVETCYSAFFASEHPQSPGLLAGKVTLQIEAALNLGGWLRLLEYLRETGEVGVGLV